MIDYHAPPPPYSSQALSEPEALTEPARILNNYGEHELLNACRNGDLHFLKNSPRLKNEINYLFESKDKNCPFYNKSVSLLHIACLNNDPELADYLLITGASVNKESTIGKLPIHIACTLANKTSLEEYVDKAYELVHKLLVQHQQSGWDINQPYNVGSDGAPATLLTLACQSGNEGAVRALLENGADPDGNKSCHKNPLHALCEGKEVNERILAALYQANANLNTTFHGATPLHQLCSHQLGNKQEQVKATKALIDYGADLLAENKKGWQAIHCAAESGNHKLVEQLLETTKVDVNARVSSSRYGPTPVHLAAFSGCHPDQKEQTLKILLEQGADIELKANVNPYEGCDAVCGASMSLMYILFPPLLCLYFCTPDDIPVHLRHETRYGATFLHGLCTVSPIELIADQEMRARIRSIIPNGECTTVTHQPTA